MRLSQVDLNLFVVFETIYSRRNLTRAAEQLCITQPAVSNALNRMRKTFNDPLFVSTPQGMVPTPVADNIARHAGEALQLLNAAVHEGAAFHPTTARKVFRLGMSDLSEAIFLPALGEALRREAPGIGIESHYPGRREIPLELATGGVDLAIDIPSIDDPLLHHVPLLRDRYAVMLRHGHPFQGDNLTLEDYLALEHIHVSSRRRGVGQVDAELNRLGCRRTIQMRVQHYLVAPIVALRSDLALTAPTRLLSGYDARIIELPFPLSPLELHCYWHRSADQDQANQWLRARFLAFAGASLVAPDAAQNYPDG